MTTWTLILTSIVLPYMICSLNFAIIVIKLKTGKDIRTIGSKNAGLTNTIRAGGKSAAIFVLIGDLSKGIISVLLVRLMFYYFGSGDAKELLGMWSFVPFLAGFFACIGHIFPIYYRFKGGKGVLVTLGVLYVIDPFSASILLGIFLVIVALTRYVSLGSIVSGSLYPICIFLLDYYFYKTDINTLRIFFSSLIAIMLIFMHRSNIKRLVSGTENKFGVKK